MFYCDESRAEGWIIGEWVARGWAWALLTILILKKIIWNYCLKKQAEGLIPSIVKLGKLKFLGEIYFYFFRTVHRHGIQGRTCLRYANVCESLEPYGPPPSFTILKYTVQYNNLIAKERIGRRGVHYRQSKYIKLAQIRK